MNHSELHININDYFLKEIDKNNNKKIIKKNLLCYSNFYESKYTGELFLIKILSKKFFKQGKLINNFIERIKIIKSFNNSYILKIYNIFEDNKNIYIVQEYTGNNLEEYWNKNKKLNEGDTLTIIIQLMLVVNYIHEKQIILKYLNPKNIWFTIDGSIKLNIIDLIIFNYKTIKMSKNNELINYIAPEIILNKKFDKSVDIWSIGVLLFKLINGSLPFNIFNVDFKYIFNYKFYKTKEVISKDCKILIFNLINYNPNLRLKIFEIKNYLIIQNICKYELKIDLNNYFKNDTKNKFMRKSLSIDFYKESIQINNYFLNRKIGIKNSKTFKSIKSKNNINSFKDTSILNNLKMNNQLNIKNNKKCNNKILKSCLSYKNLKIKNSNNFKNKKVRFCNIDNNIKIKKDFLSITNININNIYSLKNIRKMPSSNQINFKLDDFSNNNNENLNNLILKNIIDDKNYENNKEIKITTKNFLEKKVDYSYKYELKNLKSQNNKIKKYLNIIEIQEKKSINDFIGKNKKTTKKKINKRSNSDFWSIFSKDKIFGLWNNFINKAGCANDRKKN